MRSNHCFEFEFPAQIYKNHKQQLSNKARKGEQKIGRARSIYSWSSDQTLDREVRSSIPTRYFFGDCVLLEFAV